MNRKKSVYQRQIDALIPLAEEEANRIAGAAPGKHADRRSWAQAWDAAFHNAMNRFAYREGLRRLACQVRRRETTRLLSLEAVNLEAETFAQQALGVSFDEAVVRLRDEELPEALRTEVAGRRALIELLARQKSRPLPPSSRRRPAPPVPGKKGGAS